MLYIASFVFVGPWKGLWGILRSQSPSQPPGDSFQVFPAKVGFVQPPCGFGKHLRTFLHRWTAVKNVKEMMVIKNAIKKQQPLASTSNPNQVVPEHLRHIFQIPGFKARSGPTARETNNIHGAWQPENLSWIWSSLEDMLNTKVGPCTSAYIYMFNMFLTLLGFLQVPFPNIPVVLVRFPSAAWHTSCANQIESPSSQHVVAKEVHGRTHQKMEKSIPTNTVCSSTPFLLFIFIHFRPFPSFLPAVMQKSCAHSPVSLVSRALLRGNICPDIAGKKGNCCTFQLHMWQGFYLTPVPWLPEGQPAAPVPCIHSLERIGWISEQRSPASTTLKQKVHSNFIQSSPQKDQEKSFTSRISHFSILPRYHFVHVLSHSFHHLHHLSNSDPIFSGIFLSCLLRYLTFPPPQHPAPGVLPPRCQYFVMKPRPTPLARGKPISGTHLEGNLHGVVKGGWSMEDLHRP